MYTLRDTFNNRTISNHRTLAAACNADKKHDVAVKRANGSSSYIPTEILKDGKRLDDAEYDEMCKLQARDESTHGNGFAIK